MLTCIRPVPVPRGGTKPLAVDRGGNSFQFGDFRPIRELASGILSRPRSRSLGVGYTPWLGSALQCKDLFLHRGWKVHKHKVTFVIKVILATLINDSRQIISGRSRIGKNPINLAGDERRLVVAVVDTKSEQFRLCFHHSSK